MTKRTLLVGSSFSAAPIFFELKKRGHHVSVCGSVPADPCHQYADRSFHVDYSDREALLALVEVEHFDYLVPTCNDFSYISCAWVAEHRGFAGFDHYAVANILHTKNVFRELMENGDFHSPRARRLSAGGTVDVEGLRFPLLVKPVDSFSGRGVSKIGDVSALSGALNAAQQASRSGDAVVEEFVVGRLFSHSAFVREQVIVADFFVDEFCTVYPFQVNCSHHPSSLPDTQQAAVRAEITRLVEILGMTDGLLHTQFIAEGESYWIIECMRRCPGDLYGHLVELSTGVPYADFFVRPFIGEDLPTFWAAEQIKPVGRHTVSTDQAQISYAFSCRVPDAEVRIVPLKNSGERLAPAPFDKLAIIFAEYGSMAAMFEHTPRLAEFVTIHQHRFPGEPGCIAREGNPF
jgi:formate-dependent phosphoribosylglycinamide formyltransferase (GAR transformylase)